jgi:hypothetical protein
MQGLVIEKLLRIELCTFLIFSTSLLSQDAIADWKRENTLKRNGDLVEIVCVGEGPSLSIARHESLNSCDLNVSRFLNRTIEIESTSIETLKDIFIHSQIKESKKVNGLECLPQKEEIEESKGAYRVWIKCKYNLKAVVVSKPLETRKPISKKNEDNQFSDSHFGKVQTDGSRFVEIISIPNCERIVIEGNKPRIIKCKYHPTSITLYENDERIYLEAPGYKPKSIDLSVDYDFTKTIFLERK